MHPHAATLDLASLPRWALTLPCVLQPRSSPSCRGGHQRGHMFRGPEHRLLAEVSSGATTCPSASDLHLLAEVCSGVTMCPMVPGSASPRGELWCYHVFHGPQRAVDHMNKERLSCPKHAAMLMYSQGTLTCYRGACKTCG
jgi:hypothetical protein